MTFDDFLIDNYVVTSASRDDTGGFYVHFTPKERYDYLKVEAGDSDGK